MSGYAFKSHIPPGNFNVRIADSRISYPDKSFVAPWLGDWIVGGIFKFSVKNKRAHKADGSGNEDFNFTFNKDRLIFLKNYIYFFHILKPAFEDIFRERVFDMPLDGPSHGSGAV